MSKSITHNISRAALTLLMTLAMSLTASAQDIITDVMVIGYENESQMTTLMQNLTQQGWTETGVALAVGTNINFRILFKDQFSTDNSHVPITDIYIRTGSNPPATLTHQGRTYYLFPCQGCDSFVNSQGNLNFNAGGTVTHLYYTKDVLSDYYCVNNISISNYQSGGLGANGSSTSYNLGTTSFPIYIHISTTQGTNVVTLDSGIGDLQLYNGHILFGWGGQNTHVTIADGATVTLIDVNITAISNDDNHQWAGITCLGNATIVLNQGTTNSVKGV